jgi:hypothetical protein
VLFRSFKALFLGYLFGVRSERQLMREIQVNVAYRWFLRLRLTGPVFDASTLSQNRRRRYGDTTVAQEIEAYYRDNWLSVAVAFRTQLSMMDIDEEARAVFDEALAAHGAGLYRAAVRALFPEIERVAREHLLEGTLKGIASLTEVRRAAGDLGWSELQKFGEGPIFGQFAAMSHHLYEVVKTPERIAELIASPIPNRHAALHGLVAYSSLQSSLAALIMTEFMFKAISILKAQPEIVPAPKVQLLGTDASPLS